MNIGDQIEERLEYWEDANLRQMRSRESQIFKVTIERLEWTIKGTYMYENQKVPFVDFKRSVDCFATKVFNPDYLPKRKKPLLDMTLKHFIYWRFAPNPDLKLPLLFHLSNPPLLITQKHHFKVDEDLQEEIIKAYTSQNGGRVEGYDQFKNVSLATWKLQKFFKEYGHKIDDDLLTTNKEKAEVLLRHILASINHNLSKLNTRSLTWNWIWDALPGFFTHHGYFVSTKRKSIAQLEEEANAKRNSTRSRPVLKRRGRRVQ